MYIAYTAIYVYNHSYTNNLSRTWTVSINITSLKFNQGHFLTSLLHNDKRTKEAQIHTH